MIFKSLLRTSVKVAVVALILAAAQLQTATAPVVAATAPELPRVYLDTTYPTLAPGHNVLRVDQSCSGISNCTTNLQTAIDNAQMGDEIVLTSGQTFTGDFVLKNKATGSGWIVIRPTNLSSLPSETNRISPQNVSNMAKIVAPGNGLYAIETEAYAHHYRLVGLEVTEPANDDSNVLIQLGSSYSYCGTPTDLYKICDASYLNMVPHDLVLDRMYIHGQTNYNVKRGVGLDSKSSAIINSYISDIHVVGQDSQAIDSAYGPGPYKIVNNYLAGSTENYLTGGDTPRIQGVVPSDIEFRNNYIHKPLSWKIDDPSYAGKHWAVKNLFELKNSQRMLIDGNVMENNWVDGQSGFAILFTVRAEYGACPWCTVRDITYTNNILRNSAAALSITGFDNYFESPVTTRVKVANNLFENIGGVWGGNGWAVMVPGGLPKPGPYDLVLDHNTFLQTGNAISPGEDVASTKPNTVITNNIFAHNDYGVIGAGTGVGNNTLSTYFPGVDFNKNILMGGTSSWYSQYPNNYFPANWGAVFANQPGGDYHVLSAYRSAGTDGKDLGVNVDTLNGITAYVKSGTGGVITSPTPTPAPAPTPPPVMDTSAPVVTSYSFNPTTSSGSVTASFTITDAGGSFLKQAELWRTPGGAGCTDTDKSGCAWELSKTIFAPSSVSSWTASTVESPAVGTFYYGIHALDNANNLGLEPAMVKVTITTASSPVVGDLNLDHIVNSIDYSILNSRWFTNDATADLSHDGIVNSIDFSILNSNWFKTW